MNTALILAGGRDPRFSMDIPKQFINVNNRPVIVYTLEIFQNHPDIDEIIVTCVDGWLTGSSLILRKCGRSCPVEKTLRSLPIMAWNSCGSVWERAISW